MHLVVQYIKIVPNPGIPNTKCSEYWNQYDFNQLGEELQISEQHEFNFFV